MKTIQIQAEQFFEMLKSHKVTVWDVFENMIDGEQKHVFFLDAEQKVVADYILPATKEELSKDVEIFKNDLAEKLGLI